MQNSALAKSARDPALKKSSAGVISLIGGYKEGPHPLRALSARSAYT